jgi:hypothetical protein
MSSGSEVVWYKRESDQQLFGVGPLYVTRWCHSVNLDTLRQQNDAQLKHIEKIGGRIPILAVIDHPSMPKLSDVDGPFREAAREMAQQNEAQVLAISYVVTSEGFVGSITRSLIAGVNMAMRAPYGTHVASTLDAGVVWLAGHLDDANLSYDSDRLATALAEAEAIS